LPLYLLEVFLVLVFETHFEQIIVFNFALKVCFALLVAFWLKNFLFKNKKHFYKLFILFCLLNPFLASYALYLILKLGFINIILSKLLSDILVSLVTFFGLKALPD